MISIKILNQGAWARTYERQPVSLPRELEDFIPEVEDFYKVNDDAMKSVIGLERFRLLNNRDSKYLDNFCTITITRLHFNIVIYAVVIDYLWVIDFN